MKHSLPIFFVLLVIGYSAKAEEKIEPALLVDATAVQSQISGTVTDADGLPLAGANVVEKGSTNGTVTDFDGNYQIAVGSEEAVLVFSYVGYVKKEVAVDSQITVNVVLEEDQQGLDEVVVVGYGTQEKRKLTGAISSLETKTISQNINADPVTSLQGQAAGVQVTQSSGQPGGAIRVRVRGSASLLSGGDPLVVVDGIPIITSTFGTNPNDGISGLAEINPNDIASMEILKDGAAAAIYGSRAANGVILITTKKGTPGKSTLSLDFQSGINAPSNRVDLLNSDELRAVNRRAWQNTAFSGTGAEEYFPIPRDVDVISGLRRAGGRQYGCRLVGPSVEGRYLQGFKSLRNHRFRKNDRFYEFGVP